MVMYQLFQKQKDMALADQETYKKSFDYAKLFTNKYDMEVKQTPTLPPNFKLVYYGLIDGCINDLTIILENKDALSYVENVYLYQSDYPKNFRKLVLYYKTYIQSNLKFDKELLITSQSLLSTLFDLLNEVIKLAEDKKLENNLFNNY